jgi:drug/metabolite transporter (DMT)-like permease
MPPAAQPAAAQRSAYGREETDEEHALLGGDAGGTSDRSQQPEGRRLVAHTPRYRVLLPLLCVLFVTSIVDSVLAKKVAIGARNYPYTISMLSPVAGMMVYGSMCLRLRHTGKLEDKETRMVAWWKVAVVGILFASHNVLRNLGNRGDTISGAVVILMAKLNVFVSAVLSMLPPLRRRFNVWQWSAMLLLLGGIAVTIGPQFAQPPEVEGAALSHQAEALVMIIVSVVPTAMGMLFIELQVQHRHPKLNVVVLWMKICVMEFALGSLLAPVNAQLQGLKMSDILGNAVDGLLCMFLGQNVAKDDDCEGIPKFYLSTIVFGCAFNLSMAGSIKEGGATLMWFVRAMTLPAGAFVFTIPFVMGEQATTLTGFEIAGVGVVFAALTLYTHGTNKAER